MQTGMRTAVLEAPRRFGMADRPKPVAGSCEVVVKIAATAVCHTDLAIYTGEHPGVRYPVVMGHESTGVIDAVGPDVAGLQPGQAIIINPIISCGHCDSCLRGAGHLCRNAGLFGREVEGSMSEYVNLAARYVHPLPAQLPLANATLIETLANPGQPGTVQDDRAATHAPMLSKLDAAIDWSWPATLIHNRTRGFYPWPGTMTQFRDHTLRFWKTRVSEDRTDTEPGRVLANKGPLKIACGHNTVLELLEVQQEGRNRVGGADFRNGLRIVENEIVGA